MTNHSSKDHYQNYTEVTNSLTQHTELGFPLRRPHRTAFVVERHIQLVFVGDHWFKHFMALRRPLNTQGEPYACLVHSARANKYVTLKITKKSGQCFQTQNYGTSAGDDVGYRVHNGHFPIITFYWCTPRMLSTPQETPLKLLFWRTAVVVGLKMCEFKYTSPSTKRTETHPFFNVV